MEEKPKHVHTAFLSSTGFVFRRDDSANTQAGVPLWAFIVMTVFSLVLMAFVCLLLWRPFLFRTPPSAQDGGEKGAKSMGSQDQQQQQQQANLLSRGGSFRQAWFRSGGSLRSNINRWRRGVDREEEQEAPFPSSVSVIDDPAANSYAPAQARPVSYMQRIPEQYEHYGEAKPPAAQERW